MAAPPTMPVDLWVRAGADGVRNGADPVSHQIFMVLLLKADGANPDLGGLHFNVKTNSIHKPNEEFRSTGLKHTPALIHGEEVLEQPDEIIEYLDSLFRAPSLQYFDPEADTAVADVFHRFCFFIREVEKDHGHLETELRRVDAHMRESATRFLTGGSFTHLDCRILPYLQHIRIAAAVLKGYQIPTELTGLWGYLRNAYASEVFTKSCPSDQEILLYWAERKDTPNISPAKCAEMANEEPQFSFHIPS